jgi:spectinomycin phosphotransferase
MREPPPIPEESLRACLLNEYGLVPATVEFLPRGQDYAAAVYRVVTQPGQACLLKVKAGSLYEPGCRVPSYLRAQGIASVVAPIPTHSQALWARLADWSVIVYPFIDGDTSLTGMTREQWQETGDIFRRIHQVPLPPAGFESLRMEHFAPAPYTSWIREFEAHHLHVRSGARDGDDAAQHVRASWSAHQATIDLAMDSLEKLAITLRGSSLPRVICHADLHPANLLRDRAGRVFVIDWDDVMLAPRERDFVFIRGPHADAFWDGYGLPEQERDWAAQTYYQWERVVSDLIEYAGLVFSQDDWSEETRLNNARRFEANLADGAPNLNAAYAAAAHLGHTGQ